MEPIVIIIIIISVVNALVKSKKKRELAAKKAQAFEAKRQQSDGTSWQPSYTPATPLQPLVQPTVQPYADPYLSQTAAQEGGASSEYSELSVPTSSRNQAPISGTQMQSPITSRNQAPITSRNQAPIGSQMQTAGRSNNAPVARPFAPTATANPFGLFGDLINEIKSEIKNESAQTAKANPYATAQDVDNEGNSQWSEAMQSGSLGNTPGTDEGDCDDIAHYHSRVEGGSMLPASGMASMTSSMLNNAMTITSTGTASPILAPVAKGSMQMNRNDMRRAVIWAEILKRPQYGIPPRMR